MEYYQNRRCVTVEDLTRADDGEAVMTVQSYRGYLRRNYLRFMRRGGGLGCYALIDFESLPPRYKARFIDKYGDPKEVLKDKPITEELVTDRKARDFYADWLLPSGIHMTKEQQAEYTVNASVLNVLSRLVNERRSRRRAHGGNAGDFWASILVTSENYREFTGHTLPAGRAQLQNKLNVYKKDGYAAILSGKLGNSNTVKITDEMGDQIVALRRCRVPVYNTTMIFETINRMAPERGWKPLRSEKSIVQYLMREDVAPRWWDAVYGEGEAHKMFSRKHKTTMPEKRDALWYSDGTKLNLFYKAVNQKGEVVMRTAMVYEVMDAYTEVFLGYHISDTENFDAQYRAYRMAIETYRHRPYEIVVDNQGGHRKAMNSGFFKRITGKIARFTAPYNASGKSIESAFGRFQKQVLKKDWRFTGMNVTAKSQDSRPNIEFIEDNKEHLFTLPELKEAYARARNEWNMMMHPASKKSRLSTYLDSHNAAAPEVDRMDLMEMFWLQTAKPVQFTQNGISITIEKQKYTFEVFDAEGLPDLAFRRKHTYGKFVVMYDPLDMTYVRLFSQDKNGGLRYVADAFPYASIARAKQDQTAEDAAFIRTMVRMADEERVARLLEAAELETAHDVAPEQFGLNRPGIAGFTQKRTERLMNKVSKPEPEPRDEIVDVGSHQKYISNLTPLETGSRYDKM